MKIETRWTVIQFKIYKKKNKKNTMANAKSNIHLCMHKNVHELKIGIKKNRERETDPWFC